MAPKRKQGALQGQVFAITGTLSMKRAEFVALIESNGGTFAKSVTKAVTHLVSADPNTQKAAAAREKGVTIVDEDWVVSAIGSGGAAPAKKAAKKATKPAKKAKKMAAEEAGSSGGGSGLSGKVFCITGTLSVSRSEFKDFIEENGGTVVGSVSGKVTHLVSARSDTSKAQKARDQGVDIVDEAWVRREASGGSGGAIAGGKSSGKSSARMFVMEDPYQAVELSKAAGGWSSWESGEEDCMVPDDLVYGKIQHAPAAARKIATKLDKALNNVNLPAGESDTTARVVVITTDGQGIADNCFDALGIKSKWRENVTLNEISNMSERKAFFDEDDEVEDEDLEDEVRAGTKIMAKELKDHFDFNFDDTLVATPRLYGGLDSDGNIVAVLSFRVWT